MLHAVIMAGGAGTRFWPESRADRPKQLLALFGSRTMIQATADRLLGLVPPEQTLVVTNRRLVGAIARQLDGLNPDAILGEPAKRDTAPAIGLSAMMIARHDPQATMLVMPSDHVIEPLENFQAAVRQAVALVDAAPRRIVTFGIRPTYPAETFGYIQRGDRLPQPTGKSQTANDSVSGQPAPAYSVKQFREKPKADMARQYFESGNFYWNSGIFVWRASTILDELAARQPKMMAHLKKIVAAIGTPDFAAVFEREFSAIDGVSIDYAVMEHARDVAVIEAPFQWDDVGNWQALARLRGSDVEGNTINARHLGLDTRGCIVFGGSNHLIVTLGMQDCIVVHTPDATLVANRHDEEAIRDLVKLIEERGWTEYL